MSFGLNSLLSFCPDNQSLTFGLQTTLELDGADRSYPATNLGWIWLVHVEEVCHDGFYRGFATVVGLHRDDAAKDLDRSSIPVFDNVVLCCEPCVDECPEVFTDRFTSIPFSDTEATCRILREAVKTSTKVLSSISFRKASSHSGGFRDC